MVGAEDPRLLEIMANGGRAAQEKAMEDAIAYDDETAELLEWFADESAARKLRGAA